MDLNNSARKSSRQVKLTEKMKSFTGFAVNSPRKLLNGRLDFSMQSPNKNSEDEDNILRNISNKKQRLMDDNDEREYINLSTTSHEFSESENSLLHNTSNEELPLDETVDDNEEFSEYELLQRKNIEERNQFLKSLGIKNDLNDLISARNQNNKKINKTPQAVRRLRPEEILPKREPSRRLRALAAAKSNIKENFGVESFKNETEQRIEETEAVDARLKGTISLPLDEEELNLLKSFPSLDENCTYDPSIDLKSCNLESFRNNLACLHMIGPYKVTDKRIQSLYFHPSITKQIVLAGSVTGALVLWDINAAVENDVVEFSYHNAPLNCISVSAFNSNKIVTTSHEGSVCIVDIEQKKCSNAFTTDSSYRVKHLTWHEEVDANTLLISHGNGSVGLLDLREGSNNKISWINCFERSCRTVQLHPIQSNYFLASSGSGGCKIFDLRSSHKNECVSDLEHSKGLTSGFFSPDGNNILTTSNDDRLRMYDSSNFIEKVPKQKLALVHNNHTGRWLSVFKANWFPYRADTFFVGSLLSPRRIQIYESSGSVLYELHHDDMLTISPVIAVHPRLPLIAGGNSSGKIHAFLPPKSQEI